MKTIHYLGLTTLALGLFMGACDDVEEASIINVDVPDFSISIPANISAPTDALRSASEDEYKPFFGTATLDIETVSSDLAKYKDLIKEFKIGDLIFMAQNIVQEINGQAKNVRIYADGIDGAFSLDNYQFGQSIFGNPLLIGYAEKIFNKLITDGTVTINISGNTNLPEGETLHFDLDFIDLEVKAQVLKLK